MSNTLLHTLIAQQLKSIMKDKGITMYRLMQRGINQSNIEALLQKKDVSYTVKTLYKMLDELEVSEITINLEKGSVTIK
jgi:transcriptional regulator with XRE-family HTH domain